jgi:hypothetical protein
MSRLKTAALVACSVVGLPLLAVVLGGVWLTGVQRADAEAWKRTRRTSHEDSGTALESEWGKAA